MSIQNIQATNDSNTLQLMWKVYEEGVKAITVEISTNSEFTENSRQFVLPSDTTNVSLDIGNGYWYFRLGAWLPNGQIDWSGVYGPITIISSKGSTPLTTSNLRINYTQSIVNGVRLHTNMIEKGYYCIEYTTTSSFAASNRKSMYFYDALSNGFADCSPLEPTPTYTIRISYLGTSLPSNTVFQVPIWNIVKNQKTYPLTKRTNTQEPAGIKAAELTLLREAREKPTRFTSQGDYLTYLTAKTKNVGKINIL